MTGIVEIYDIPQVVKLTLGGLTGATQGNYQINQTDFKIVKGIYNQVYFFIKDTNNRPITNAALTAMNYDFVRIIVTDPEQSGANALLLGYNIPPTNSDDDVLIPAPGIDPLKGVWSLNLDVDDTANWPSGNLQYSVMLYSTTGDQTLLYTDKQYGPYSNFKVVDSPFPETPDPITILANAMLSVSSIFNNNNLVGGLSYYSSPYPGAAQVGNLTGQHYAVANCVEMTGSFTVQASLENYPPKTDADWFLANVYSSSAGVITTGTVSFMTGTPVTGPLNIYFNGNYTWVRFVVYNNAIDGGIFNSIDYQCY